MTGTGMGRRAVLQAAAGLAASQFAPGMAARAQPMPTPGKPGDFDFLAGKWKIAHRMKKGADWDVFDGEATCWTILAGIGSVEELRIPARGFSGMGLRLLDMEKKIWSDFWVNAKSGVLTAPGMPGSFENGVGTFASEDVEDGKPMIARGVWDRITPTSCRWRQGISRDGGRSWDEGWFMDWTRV